MAFELTVTVAKWRYKPSIPASVVDLKFKDNITPNLGITVFRKASQFGGPLVLMNTSIMFYQQCLVAKQKEVNSLSLSPLCKQYHNDGDFISNTGTVPGFPA